MSNQNLKKICDPFSWLWNCTIVFFHPLSDIHLTRVRVRIKSFLHCAKINLNSRIKNSNPSLASRDDETVYYVRMSGICMYISASET